MIQPVMQPVTPTVPTRGGHTFRTGRTMVLTCIDHGFTVRTGAPRASCQGVEWRMSATGTLPAGNREPVPGVRLAIVGSRRFAEPAAALSWAREKIAASIEWLRLRWRRRHRHARPHDRRRARLHDQARHIHRAPARRARMGRARWLPRSERAHRARLHAPARTVLRTIPHARRRVDRTRSRTARAHGLAAHDLSRRSPCAYTGH